MTTLRITNAATGVEEVYTDVDLAEGALDEREAVQDGEREIDSAEVGVHTALLLGAATKHTFPSGYHRARLESDGDTVIDGMVRGETISHGRLYAGAGTAERLWTVTVEQAALDQIVAELEAVQLRDLESSGALATLPTYAVTHRLQTGSGLESYEVVCYSVADLIGAAVGALPDVAPLALPDLFPYAVSYIGGGEVRERVIVPTVVVVAPRPLMDPAPEAGASALPDWTAWQLVEAVKEQESLLIEAAYAPYPTSTIAATLREGLWVELSEAEVAARPTIDAWAEDYDWQTEPVIQDGEPISDFAVCYAGCYRSAPDGPVMGVAGDPPTEAVYAALQRRLSDAGDDEGEPLNEHVLDLPWMLPSIYDVTELDDDAPPDYVGKVYVGDPLLDLDHKDDTVLLLSVLDAGSGDWRAVHRRQIGPPGLSSPGPGQFSTFGELWARERYPRYSLRASDVDVAVLRVPVEAVPPDAALMDPRRGVRLEGLAWAIRSMETDHDLGEVELELVRPSGAFVDAAQGSQSGIVRAAPIVTSDEFIDLTDPGNPIYYLTVDFYAPEGTSTPYGWEVDWDRPHLMIPDGRSGQITAENEDAGTYQNELIRIRGRYYGGPGPWADHVVGS